MTFTKKIPLWSNEALYTQFVASHIFSPPDLKISERSLTMARGEDLHSAIAKAASPEFVSKATICALEALHLMHKSRFLHLDAKASNFVIFRGRRTKDIRGPTDFWFDGSWHCVAIVDFETLFAPDLCTSGFDKVKFDRDAVTLASLGRKTFDDLMSMPPEQRQRADVFSFASSILNGQEIKSGVTLLSAMATILGHIPTPLYIEGENKTMTEYYTYLNDFDLPICTTEEAKLFVATTFICQFCQQFHEADPTCKPFLKTALTFCNDSETLLESALTTLGIPESKLSTLFAYLRSTPDSCN